jgi:glycosyltransferase involved in cell wall biosynthesis
VNEPLISIGMSVFNSKSTIKEAIHSLLLQSYANWELILIDDGSNDRSMDVVYEFGDPRIRKFSDGQNLGLAKRLNQAISLSNGLYFARMDSDDISYPERLSVQLRFLELHPEIDLVGARVVVFDNNGQALGTHRSVHGHDSICKSPFDSFPLAHPTWMGRIEWFRKYGYKNSSKCSEDQDLLLRSHHESRFECLPEVLLGYRQNNVTFKKELRAKISYAIDIYEYHWAKGNYFEALLGVFIQISKSVYIAISLSFGLQRKMLSRRFGRVSDSERMSWISVYKSVSSLNS